MEIAKYYASLGFVVPKDETNKVDNYLKNLSKKFSNFQVNLPSLTKTLGDALDQASKKTVFEISNFSVNRAALQSTMQRAMRGSVSMNIPSKQASATQQSQSTSRPAPRSAASNNRANYLHAGGATGAFMRYGAASLPLIGGVYGASALNTANQDLVNANISAESVLGGRSKELLDRLSERSNYMGINYADTLPQFTKFMASSMPLMGVDSSQQTFESFMQFGRTRGASKVSMNRALTAVGQMSAKGQVMAEELKGQLGDAAGFGEVPQLFAEAYQIQTGGNLTGAKARAALMDAMQNGQVKTADILPLVAKLMDELSKGGIEKARMSSSAQQMRAENAISGRGGLLQTFSESGGETGFARLWSSFAVAMKEAKPAVESLSRAFDEISKYASFAILLPQSFKRAFEGRDSWVADQLGAKNIQLIKDWYGGISDINTEIKTLLGTAVEGWRLYFQEFGDEWLALLTGIQGVLLYSLKAINAAIAGEGGKASNYMAAAVASATGKSREEAEAIANGVSPPMGVDEVATGVKDVLSYTPVGYVADKYISGYEWLGEKTGVTSWAKRFGVLMDKGLSDEDRASIDYQREMAMSREQFKASQNNQVNINSGAIVINANTSDPEALSEILMSKLKDQTNYLITGQYTEALVHFPEG